MSRDTILIVDDSPTILQILQATLTAAGWSVLSARDGQSALAHADTPGIGLVISDWTMPEMGGLELIQTLRGRDDYATVPILVLTTETDPEFKAAARDAGATGWLQKPIDPELLVDVVRQLLDAADHLQNRGARV